MLPISTCKKDFMNLTESHIKHHEPCESLYKIEQSYTFECSASLKIEQLSLNSSKNKFISHFHC
jgi:hypothetical protein